MNKCFNVKPNDGKFPSLLDKYHHEIEVNYENWPSSWLTFDGNFKHNSYTPSSPQDYPRIIKFFRFFFNFHLFNVVIKSKIGFLLISAPMTD